MTLSPSDFRKYAPSFPVDQQKAEVRLMAVVITGTFLYNLLETVMYLATVETSMVRKVAGLSTLPGNSNVFIGLFLLSAALTVPHFLALCFAPERLSQRMPRKLATRATMIAAVAWAWLSALSFPLDVGFLPFMYFLNSAGCVIVGLVYGFSLNSQQLRKLSTDETPEIG